jgi:undecaprenyl-diphosphatase
MGAQIEKFAKENPLVQPIHTAVKARARYKVNGLYGSPTLKKYLELRLQECKGIVQVRANHHTGNVLVILNPDWNFQAIAALIQDIVWNYRIQAQQQASTGKPKISPHPYAQNVIPKITSSSKIFIRQFQSLSTAFLLAAAGLSLASRKLTNATIIVGAIVTNAVIGYAKSQVVSSSTPVVETPQQKKILAGKHLALLSATIGGLVFCTLLLHVFGLDTVILLAIYKLHTPLLDRLMVAITTLGNPTALLLICSGLAIGPLFSHRRQQATTLSIAAVGALGWNYWLKAHFGRARPALWDWIVHAGHYSFPSGHAMGSIVIYGFLAYTLAEQFPQWRKQIFTSSTILILTIGLSRLYLGVHWPTDVAAGYAVGLMWLIACLIAEELWQKYYLPSPTDTHGTSAGLKYIL